MLLYTQENLREPKMKFKNEETNCFIGYDMWHYASALG